MFTRVLQARRLLLKESEFSALQNILNQSEFSALQHNMFAIQRRRV